LPQHIELVLSNDSKPYVIMLFITMWEGARARQTNIWMSRASALPPVSSFHKTDLHC